MVTLIGRVAVLSIAVSTAAMILILSVMNGMNRFVSERFWMVDPDLRVEPVEGKFFTGGDVLERLKAVPGVEAVSGVLQDQALLVFGEHSCMIRLKGVDSSFGKVSDVVNQITSGTFDLGYGAHSASVLMGNGVYGQLQIYASDMEACRLYTVDADMLSGPFAMQTAFSSYAVHPSGLFSSIPEYDNQYVFCDLDFASQVFRLDSSLSAVEIKLEPGATLGKVKDGIRNVLGEGLQVKDRIEQQQSMFRSMKAEKLIVLAVFSFVMLIATFTMVANQMLLMYEKRRDVAVLSSMGMPIQRIKGIFLIHGIGVTLSGTLSGLILGTLLCWGQQHYGWVKLGGGGGSFLTDAYPVAWQLGDALTVMLIGFAIGCLASIVPLRQVNSFLRKGLGSDR